MYLENIEAWSYVDLSFFMVLLILGLESLITVSRSAWPNIWLKSTNIHRGLPHSMSSATSTECRAVQRTSWKTSCSVCSTRGTPIGCGTLQLCESRKWRNFTSTCKHYVEIFSSSVYSLRQSSTRHRFFCINFITYSVGRWTSHSWRTLAFTEVPSAFPLPRISSPSLSRPPATIRTIRLILIWKNKFTATECGQETWLTSASWNCSTSPNLFGTLSCLFWKGWLVPTIPNC